MMSQEQRQKPQNEFVTRACKGKSTTMADYPQLAMQRWSGKVIHGEGRFAIPYGSKVHLFATYADAKAMALFRDVRIEDLAPSYVPSCSVELGYE
jgi:hypothetical protein